MKAVVSEKGQVTIPKELREHLGLTRGTILDFEAVEGTLVARKDLATDPIAKWRGRGRLPDGAVSVDAYVSAARDADCD